MTGKVDFLKSIKPVIFSIRHPDNRVDACGIRLISALDLISKEKIFLIPNSLFMMSCHKSFEGILVSNDKCQIICYQTAELVV